MTQIQIIATPEALQSFFDSSIGVALKNLGFNNTAMVKPTNEKPLTVKELCAFLGVTEATVIRWRSKGTIPFMKLGSRILFDKSAVLSALESKKK